MITQRILGLLHTRLVASAPQQAGSHEYRMGIDDAIAGVRRLIEAETPWDDMGSWETEASDTGTEGFEETTRTQLAAAYLQLELTSLLTTIDSILRQSTAPRTPGDAAVSSLLDAKAHLLRARGALRQSNGSVLG